MKDFFSSIEDNWSLGDEGKVLVVLFFLLVVGSFVGLVGFLMPFLVSAKSTLLVILGFISPVIYVGLVINFYRIFFKSKERLDA
jgi:hypothetical protein